MTASMDTHAATSDVTAAAILAVILTAKGHVKESELSTLERSNAFELLGVNRSQFVALTEAGYMRSRAYLNEHHWLCSEDLNQIDRMLATVSSAEQRLLICRLAAATFPPDLDASKYDRLVYDHARAQWHITELMVEDAQRQVDSMQVSFAETMA